MGCTSYKNTGVGSCDTKAPIAKGLIFAPKGAVIPTATADVMTFLEGKFKNNNIALRWFPMLGIEQNTSAGTEATIGTLALGYSEKLRDATIAYKFDFPFRECKNKTIVGYDDWQGGVFVITTDNRIMGKLVGTDLVAFDPRFVNAMTMPMGDGQNISLSSLSVDFGYAIEFAKSRGFVTITDYDETAMAGIIDVELTSVGSGTGYIEVAVTEACGGANLYDVYSTQLNASGVWVATTNAGAPVVISAVALVPAKKAFKLTMATGAVNIKLAAISVLEAALIEGCESNTLTATIV